MNRLVSLLVCLISSGFFFSLPARAQCDSGQAQVIIHIRPDQYTWEISWQLEDINGMLLASGTYNSDTICVPASTCLRFTIRDTYGDGLLDGGFYRVLHNGQIIVEDSAFGFFQQTAFNCPPGSDCRNVIPVVPGIYEATQRNAWYSFVPDSSGMYFISTCGMNTCDTRLWVYDRCEGLVPSNTNTGTIYYDDNNGGCGSQARVNALLSAGKTYYIRVGDARDDCSAGIHWSLSYNGPVSGCMDPLACNFDPLATLSDTCYYPGNALCPQGQPDLVVLEAPLRTSIQLARVIADACTIEEGCLTAYGNRDVIRFSTHIQNTGTADYYVGTPETHPSQFSYGNCHGHWHYEGYAEYILYDIAGQAIPVGFKNGFCIMDLECSNEGSFRYGCDNMGISAGCGDIYNRDIDCQWIDITDVDTGFYTLVVRVNWDRSPDALGRGELSYTNNWAQVCIRISRAGNGMLSVSVMDDCLPYVDCSGEIYGNKQLDCTGLCGGTKQVGDLNASGSQELADAHAYVNGILGNDLAVIPCNDVNLDGRITVYDAAKVSSCVNYGESHLHQGNVPHNHCDFPGGRLNPSDTVGLQILSVDFAEQYVDIGIRNPTTRVTAYEFDLNGITVWNAESLADPDEFPVQPEFLVGGTKIIGLSYQDSSIGRNISPGPLVRVYFRERTGDTICISTIRDIVNGLFEQTHTRIEGDCFVVDVTGKGSFVPAARFRLLPNPASSEVMIDLHLPERDNAILLLSDITGRVLRQTVLDSPADHQLAWDLENIPAGIYVVQLQSPRGTVSRKLVIAK